MFFFESLGTGSDSGTNFVVGTEPAPEIVEPPKPSVNDENSPNTFRFVPIHSDVESGSHLSSYLNL